MRKIFTILFLGFSWISLFAQHISVNKADRLFQERAYKNAAEMYRLVSDKDQHVLQNLADSYFYTNRMLSAEGYYRELFNRYEGNIAPEYRFRYGNALRAMGKHEDADRYLSEYFKEDRSLRNWVDDMDSLAPYRYKTREIRGNESSSNFGLTYLGDRVIFASTRNEERPIYAWNDKPYLDLYSGQVLEDGSITDVRLIKGEVNTNTHESSATFNSDGTIMYFDRTNSNKVKASSELILVAHISIHRAELVNGIWTNITRLPFASDDYSTEHPSLSPDGTKLYFASDMPGSIGSFDIYVVDIHDDGTYGKPRNLGPNINTPEREQFPFISEGILYFSSNGHMGFGNLDIFRSDLQDGTFTQARNLGLNVNSVMDDFAFIIKEEQNEGFLTSTREGTESLYEFIREEKPKPKPEAIPEEPLEKEVIDSLLVEEPLIAEELVEENVVTGAQQLKDVSNVHFAFDSTYILPESRNVLDKVVEILKAYPKIIIEIGAHTDSFGSDNYNLMLSEWRADATLKYLVDKGIDPERLSSKGYGETMPINPCVRACTKAEHAVNRRSEFKIMNESIK